MSVRNEDEMFDYHREMAGAVSEISGNAEEYVWVMNEEHRRRYRYFLEHVMGGYPDDSESFGIGIMTGEPKNGQPVELVKRTWQGYD